MTGKGVMGEVDLERKTGVVAEEGSGPLDHLMA